MANRELFVVPEGWRLVTKVDSKGKTVKYYMNVLGQKFYSEEDLMRNIKDAKERGLSIYAPDFDASSYQASGSRHKVGESSKRIRKKEKQSSKRNEVVNEVRTGLHLSNQATGNTKLRTSRRIAGLEPEMKPDFVLYKALEYVIKDTSR